MVRTLRFTAEGIISILVGELGSHKLRGVAKKKRERESEKYKELKNILNDTTRMQQEKFKPCVRDSKRDTDV